MAVKPRLAAAAVAAMLIAAPSAWADDLQAGEAAYQTGCFTCARQHWQKAADAGDAMAAFDIGLLYDLGEGVRESDATAFSWYLHAGNQGLPEAQLNVAVMYDSGRGVRRDRAQAAIWYARAASQGNTRAAFNLGELYQAGDGVPRNLAIARAWYQQAAKAAPVALMRAKLLTRPMQHQKSGNLVPPIPLSPVVYNTIDLSTQMVWSAPPEPVPVMYFVEIGTLRNGKFQELTSAYRAENALSLHLPDADLYGWRVFAVAVDGSGYAAGPWSEFSRTPVAVDAAPRLGE